MTRRIGAVLVAAVLFATAGMVARPDTPGVGVPVAEAATYAYYVCNPGNHWVPAGSVWRWRSQGFSCYGVPTYCGRQC